MANSEPKKPARKLLFVSDNVHSAVSSMQKKLAARFGYRVTQSEAVKRGMEALEREIEASK